MKWSRAWNGIEYLDMDKGLRPKAKGARKLSREFTRVLPEEVRRDALLTSEVKAATPYTGLFRAPTALNQQRPALEDDWRRRRDEITVARRFSFLGIAPIIVLELELVLDAFEGPSGRRPLVETS
jgi:hypothetical protein